MKKKEYTPADVRFIPFSAYTDDYDSRPNLKQDPYGQLIIPNIINTTKPLYSKCRIGSYIYRSVANNYKTLVPYGTEDGHIKFFLEPNVGGHYYVMSGYSDDFSKATAEVKMSDVSCNRAGHRNGFISLSLVTGNIQAGDDTIMSQCDIGLIYTRLPNGDHDAWYPVSWSENQRLKGTNLPYDVLYTSKFIVGDSLDHIEEDDKYVPYEIPDDPDTTVRIELHAKIVTENNAKYDVVEGYIYVNGSKKAQIRYKETRGSYFSMFKEKDNSNPYVRFTRFMSLVPVETNTATQVSGDYPDDSSLHGIMRNCYLDSTRWNVNRIAFAWSVQGINIPKLSISTLAEDTVADNADECEIWNHYPTHLINMPNV